jgi:hypothetical protein
LLHVGFVGSNPTSSAPDLTEQVLTEFRPRAGTSLAENLAEKLLVRIGGSWRSAVGWSCQPSALVYIVVV